MKAILRSLPLYLKAYRDIPLSHPHTHQGRDFTRLSDDRDSTALPFRNLNCSLNSAIGLRAVEIRSPRFLDYPIRQYERVSETGEVPSFQAARVTIPPIRSLRGERPIQRVDLIQSSATTSLARLSWGGRIIGRQCARARRRRVCLPERFLRACGASSSPCWIVTRKLLPPTAERRHQPKILATTDPMTTVAAPSRRRHCPHYAPATTPAERYPGVSLATRRRVASERCGVSAEERAASRGNIAEGSVRLRWRHISAISSGDVSPTTTTTTTAIAGCLVPPLSLSLSLRLSVSLSLFTPSPCTCMSHMWPSVCASPHVMIVYCVYVNLESSRYRLYAYRKCG